MNLPLSGWGYGLAPFPIVPQFAQSDVFQGYKVHLCVL